MRPQQWAEVLNWKQIDAGPMNRWLLPAAVVALLVVGWQHRGQGLARACTGIVGRAMPAQESVSSRPRLAAKPAVPADQLLVNASQPSWLEVQNASRQVLFKGTFKGERRFPLGQGLKVLAGRPDLVQVSVGGRAARPLGTIDQIRWVSVPADQPAAAAPAPAP